MDRKTALEQTLREQGLSLTSQRRVILESLLERKDHPTAEQVYDLVRDRLPGLSRATVYRALEMLVQAGAARKVFHPGAVARFDPMVERHHHMVCQICGKLADVESSAIQDIPLADIRPSGFTITDYSINFTGICLGCQESSN